MKLPQFIKTTIENPKNRKLLKDFLMLVVASVVFHFLYWNTDMNSWLFGPFTDRVFDFFTLIAYTGSKMLMNTFSSLDFVCDNSSFYFIQPNEQGQLQCYAIMQIVHDCSAIKQIMQFLLLMVLCSGKWWKKAIYFVGGSLVIVLSNILRIYLLTDLFGHNPPQFQYYHDWVARPIMYVVIFALWAVWIQFFAYSKPKDDCPQDKRSLPSSDLPTAD